MNAANVRLASTLLRGARTQVCAVVGFPLGASTPASKAFEAREAVRHGASEIDMVINIGALKSRDFHLVSEDIAAVVEAVPGKIVKVILETSLLEDREKIIACALAKGAGCEPTISLEVLASSRDRPPPRSPGAHEPRSACAHDLRVGEG